MGVARAAESSGICSLCATLGRCAVNAVGASVCERVFFFQYFINGGGRGTQESIKYGEREGEGEEVGRRRRREEERNLERRNGREKTDKHIGG